MRQGAPAAAAAYAPLFQIYVNIHIAAGLDTGIALPRTSRQQISFLFMRIVVLFLFIVFLSCHPASIYHQHMAVHIGAGFG